MYSPHWGAYLISRYFKISNKQLIDLKKPKSLSMNNVNTDLKLKHLTKCK